MSERVFLRPVNKFDIPLVLKWANDPEVTYYMFKGAIPVKAEDLEAEWDKNIVFAVMCGRVHIGTTGLYSINWIARSAEFRIILDKNYWGNGHGTEATKLTVKYGFETLNLNKIWLGVNAENISAIRAYEKAGFIKEGILRQEIFRNNRYYDAVRMSVLHV